MTDAATTDTPADEQLLTAWIVRRDAVAFAELARRHGPMVLATCRRVTGDAAAAEDAAQETFVKLARLGRRRDEVRSSVAAWLHRVALNQARDHVRSESRRHARERAVSSNAPTASPEPGTFAAVADRVDAALDELDGDARELIVAHWLQGVEQADLAERLRCSQATISRRLAEALATLRERVAEPSSDAAADAERDVARRDRLLGVAALAAGLAERPPPVPPELAARLAIPTTNLGSLALIAIAGVAVVAGLALAQVTLSDVDGSPGSEPIPIATQVEAEPPRPLSSAGQPMTTPAPAKPADGQTFERAVAAVLSGDETTLRTLLQAHPDLVRMRATSREKPYNGYFFQATLLHHCATNPVPERAPANLIAIATLLLDAGAEVDARTRQGPDQPQDPTWTTLGLVASTADECIGPHRDALIDLLVARGADVDDLGGLPMEGALYYNVHAGANALLRHGARLDLRTAAALGDLERVKGFFDTAGRLRAEAWRPAIYVPDAQATTEAERLGEALVWATMAAPAATRAPIAELLLDRGADPRWFAVRRTALHHAAYANDEALCRRLIAAGADPTVKDRQFNSTPAGWARHHGHHALAAKLELETGELVPKPQP